MAGARNGRARHAAAPPHVPRRTWHVEPSDHPEAGSQGPWDGGIGTAALPRGWHADDTGSQYGNTLHPAIEIRAEKHRRSHGYPEHPMCLSFAAR